MRKVWPVDEGLRVSGQCLGHDRLLLCCFSFLIFISDTGAAQRVKSGTAQFTTLHRLFCVEVKYRADVEGFLRRLDGGAPAGASEQWPDLKVVIVTDRPAPGRSCFQLLDLARRAPDVPLHTVDLHTASELEINQAAIEEHQELVRGVFSLLATRSRPARAEAAPRKPPVKVASFLLAFLASFLV